MYSLPTGFVYFSLTPSEPADSNFESRIESRTNELLNEIKILKQKIHQLESGVIQQPRFKESKLFPKVQFLNYKDRRRILVNLSFLNFSS